MTCNTTELMDRLERANRDTPGMSRADRAYALLTMAATYLGGDDASTVSRIAARIASEAHADQRHGHGEELHARRTT